MLLDVIKGDVYGYGFLSLKMLTRRSSTEEISEK